MTNILKDNTNKVLTNMSMPISIGMLSTFLFQVIDTYFVGKLGANALAALSFASTIYFIMLGLFIGFSVGVSIIIGKAYGAGDLKKVKITAFLAVIFCSLLSILLSFLSVYFMGPIFSALGATEEILPLIADYLTPMLWGIPLLTTGILCGGILRATGNISKPEILMAIAGIINLVFDYALIFGNWGLPEMGIQGAAYATVISWIFVILGMLVFMFQDGLLKIISTSVKHQYQVFKQIIVVSLPTIVTQLVGPASLMYLTFLFASQSPLAVAAFGVAGRIETLLMIGVLGVSTAITPFIAQNSGAKQNNRIDEAIAFGGKASTYLGLIVALLLILFVKPVAGLFSNNLEVIKNTANYFYIVSFSYIFYGLYLITTSIFNGLESPLNSLKISLVKSFLFTVPLSYIGSFYGVKGIFIGIALGNVFAGLYSAYEMRKYNKKIGSNLSEINLGKEYFNDFKKMINRLKKNSHE